jgi:uncharacterized protein YciI
MPEWIYFIHPPRADVAAEMSAAEAGAYSDHAARLQLMLDDGSLILAGPTLGPNTGLVIFEAPDEDSARQIMDSDPVIAGGWATGELRGFRASLMRGR